MKWVNEFPNNHVLCPHPEAADWPCAIDRTFMGVKATHRPRHRAEPLTGVAAADGVNQFGSPQQPDNSWVTHLHGGEIPPSTDGFAEKWFGNAVTAPKYNSAARPELREPRLREPVAASSSMRPAGNSDTYTYPMVQEEATIWFHDHTLGKTHHNVIAGPAGFFPVKEPAQARQRSSPGRRRTATVRRRCPAGSEYTWLDPVTEPRGALGIPMYDLFFAIQDRAFNDDGSINFSNGLGQPVAAPPAPAGRPPVTNGVNPQVHPTWVPEYFGDHALVNGVLWPKKTVEPGWYRMRLVDGSDSRCYTIGFQQSALPPAPGAAVTYNVPFYVIANDQGYLQPAGEGPAEPLHHVPRRALRVARQLRRRCPASPSAALPHVWMVNNAKAPFPAGIAPAGRVRSRPERDHAVRRQPDLRTGREELRPDRQDRPGHLGHRAGRPDLGSDPGQHGREPGHDVPDPRRLQRAEGALREHLHAGGSVAGDRRGGRVRPAPTSGLRCSRLRASFPRLRSPSRRAPSSARST